MGKKSAIVLMLLTAFMPACESLTGDDPAAPVRAVIVFVTPSPTPLPTATPEPTSTNVPVATAMPVVSVVSMEATEPPTAPPPPSATPEPTPTATPEPDWLNTVGRTGDELVYLGNPDAPVTLIDYSDFL